MYERTDENLDVSVMTDDELYFFAVSGVPTAMSALMLDLDSVQKHQAGKHDQATHGNWATDNFDEETGGDALLETYMNRYGTDAKGNKYGVENADYEAMDFYTRNGYQTINPYLRKGTVATPFLLDSEGVQKVADRLDKLLAEAPVTLGKSTLYRVMDDKVLASIKVGDVMIDKGFLSTTRIDITQPRNDEARTWLRNMSVEPTDPTVDTIAIIRPNKKGNGKGLVIDMIRNAVGDASSFSDIEKEVLLPRATPLKFIGFKDNIGTEKRVAIFERMD